MVELALILVKLAASIIIIHVNTVRLRSGQQFLLKWGYLSDTTELIATLPVLLAPTKFSTSVGVFMN